MWYRAIPATPGGASLLAIGITAPEVSAKSSHSDDGAGATVTQ
jgi:hypothetical protein